MVFPINGESHYAGIKVEDQIVSFINYSYRNNNDILDIYKNEQVKFFETVHCIHIGGTHNKSDALVVYSKGHNIPNGSLHISIKKKKYIKNRASGTFDVVNKSLNKFNDEYKIIDCNKINYVNNWLEMQKEYIHSKDDIKLIRNKFADLCDVLLDDMKNNEDKLLELIKNEFFKTDFLIVGKTALTDCGEKLFEICIGKESDIKLFEQENCFGNIYSLNKGKGKSSRKIMVTTTDNKTNQTPFRVRIALNNGLSAYYGLSESNKTSVLTVKIQVDNVQYIINQMKSIVLD